jgi:HEAT repeat protein
MPSGIKMPNRKFSENELSLDLNRLALEAIGELYLAAKKVSIYSANHPMSQKAIGRAFYMMGKVFKFKRFFNLYISSGSLYAMNIRCKPSPFIDQIMNYMLALDLNDILLASDMSQYHLSLFLERFVKKLTKSDYKNLMANYLAEKKIDSIMVNSDLGERLFKNGPHYQGDVPDDYSVRKIVSQAMGDDFEFLAFLLHDENISDDEFVKKYNIDYWPELVAYLIPEKIADKDAGELAQILSSKIINTVRDYDSPAEITPRQVDEIKDLIKALNYHSRREEILDSAGRTIVENGIGNDFYTGLLPKTNSLKLESSEKIDEFIYSSFNREVPGYTLSDFKDLFSRLLRTGQQGKVKSVVNILINHLAGNDLDLRKRAVVLLRYVVAAYTGVRDEYLMRHFLIKIDEYFSEGRETFEFSDLVGEICRGLLLEKNYQILSDVCDLVASRRELVEGIWSYDSVAAKKAVEELNRPRIINGLINDFYDDKNRNIIPFIRNILITIGSREVACRLAEIISHESRNVRQNVLKILAELGKATLYVFTDMLCDDTLFERYKNKRELPDEHWYIVRNTIFVLGSLKDAEACTSLRLRVNDPDIRVRMTIIQALEKIGGEDAADLLVLLADDDDHEIRETAIIALRLVGTPDIAPELIPLIERRSANIISIINTLGKLGGHQTREFLGHLLNDREYQSRLASGRISRDDIKLAAIKALGRIGDREALDTIRQFTDSMSASQKILFGSKLNKAAEDILGNHDS